MTMNAQGRGQAVYNYMAQQGAFNRLNDAEKQTLLAGLVGLYGADLNYIVGNATIVPDTFNAPAGASVSTTGSAAAQTGRTTSAVGLGGTGKVT
ncbi:MAG: hypothetical protein EOO38_07940 [Cytophagaceae bacterium]|nr:MAG: hypothetical protein EOO38_07940 [Cytophagaceae bacterium]